MGCGKNLIRLHFFTTSKMTPLYTETKEIAARQNIDEEINPYLEQGWVILSTWVTNYGEPMERNETMHVLVGWAETSPAQHPPKKESSLGW